jgi:hypothetical protein
MNDHTHALAPCIAVSLVYENVKNVRPRLDLMKKRGSFDPAKNRTAIPQSSFSYPSTRTEFQYVALLHRIRSVLCDCYLG